MDSDNIPLTNMNGKTHYSNLEKATLFNDFFINQCKEEDDESPLPDTTQNTTSQINDIVLNVTDISKAIKDLNKKKTTGPDSVHNKLLIASVDILS